MCLSKTLQLQRISLVYQTHSTVANQEAIDSLERLAEQLESNEFRADTLDVTLDSFHTPPARVLEIFIRIFESVNRDRIREVSLCFHMPPIGDAIDPEGENVLTLIDRLMNIIPTFEKLTTFKFMLGNGACVSESCLAFVIQRLPKLHTILLYGKIGIQRKLKQYEEADLGEALASRSALKSLNIRNLNTFTTDWLKLNWQPKLEELTVEAQRPAFDETHLLRFCHLFRETLVSLNFERGSINHPRGGRDVALAQALAQGFQKLLYLTYNGHASTLWALSRAPHLEQLTWMMWLERRTDFQLFRTTHFPNEDRWPSLRRFQVPEHLQDQPVLRGICEQLKTFLQDHDIEFKFIAHDEIVGFDEALHNLDSRLYPKPIRLPSDM